MVGKIGIESNPDLNEDRYVSKELYVRGELKQCIVDAHTIGDLIISVHNLDEDLSERISKMNKEYHDHVRDVLQNLVWWKKIKIKKDLI